MVENLSKQQQLFYYARQGDVEELKQLDQSVDINALDDNTSTLSAYGPVKYCTKNSALHYAAGSGSLECVKFLCNKFKLELETKNKLNSTPLHIAASLGYTEIVTFLIEMKANIEARNIMESTPLHCAVYGGYVDTVKAILAQFRDPKQALLKPNRVGIGAVKYAQHVDIKDLLQTYFDDIDDVDEEIKANDDNQDNKSFLFDASDLEYLMSNFQEENVAISLLSQMGGIQGIAFAVHTDIIKGLNEDDDALKYRQSKYGTNHLNDVPEEVPEAKTECNIIRCGEEAKIISSDDVVVGDLIVLKEGDIIPADGIFVSGSDDFEVSEATLTGDSKGYVKNRFHPLLMRGTSVVSGEGMMIAVAVGDKTEYGQLMSGIVMEDNRRSAVCFSSDSYCITYPNYERKQIGDLEIYDKILTYDELNDKYVFDKLLVKLHFKPNEFLNNMLVPMIEFTLENAQTLTMTGNHLLYIDGQYGVYRADKVKIGDKLKYFDGTLIEVISIKKNIMKYPRNLITYNGNLVINGIAISTFTDSIWGESEIWGKSLRFIMKYCHSYNIWRYPAYYMAKLWREYTSFDVKQSILEFYFDKSC